MARLSKNGVNKYIAQEKQYSTDGGNTWHSYEPPIYRIGDLIELDSDDCK